MDSNKNGKYDPGETPLPGIYVSNGEDIIKTDDSGQYDFAFELEVPISIFITVPSGYRTSGPFYRVVPS